MSLSSFSSACVPSAFSLGALGLDAIIIEASVVANYSFSVSSGVRYIQPSVELVNATFCNVTVTYTHPGENDRVGAEVWLPPAEIWNERFQGAGGGGWGAGRFYNSYGTMAGALTEGFATVTTDAGLSDQFTPETWALISTGHVNLPLLENFGYRSLNESAVIGKSIVRQFYGRDPSYSYFNGCSQGGRQGLALAQRYPTAYDGIAASAPALHFPDLAAAIYWPQQYMNDIEYYPYGCELDAIVRAAISRCDVLDGVSDGIISDVDKCFATFDPSEMVGRSTNCSQTGGLVTISAGAASVAKATWTGAVSANGTKLWHGYRLGADLTGALEPSLAHGTAMTNCTSGTCTGSAEPLATSWFRLFLAKDPSFNASSMTRSEFEDYLRQGQQEYSSILSTDNPDLSGFRDAGGKMVTFHGLKSHKADQIIPDQGTLDYYTDVAKLLPDVHDFYRYFPIPGVGHCFASKGGAPLSLFSQLQAWVENGTAPESSPITYTDDSGADVYSRIVCPYPQKAVYHTDCGAPEEASCWSCKRAQSGCSKVKFQ
ncbi:hypothetical protein Hte_008560 [Hypoxylon texense]